MDSRYLFALAVVCYGLASFFHRIAATKISAYHIQLLATVINVATLPIFILFSSNNIKFNFNGAAISLFASCLAAVGTIFFLNGITRTNSSGLGMVISLYPTISLILSVIFLHEQITIQKAIASCLMIAGAIIMIVT